MTLIDLAIRVANRTNKAITDSTAKARIVGHINDEAKMAWEDYHWSFRWREYPVALVKDLATALTPASTATVTPTGPGTPVTGSRTVTLSTAALPDTTTHVGAFIRFLSDSIQNWYRITSVQSTSSFTIDPPYQLQPTGQTAGVSIPNLSYEIKKLDYIIPTEMTDLGTANISYMGLPINIVSTTGMALVTQPPLYRGIPQTASFIDSDGVGSTYSTGTITNTINTNTLTGSGTSWLSNVFPGDRITITGDTFTNSAGQTISYTYTVYKVVSDTSIITYQNFQKTNSSATNYISTRIMGRQMRVLPSADNPYTVYMKAVRLYPQLINDNDENDLTLRYPDAVIEGAVRRELASSPDMREQLTAQMSMEAWRKAQAADDAGSNKSNSVPVWNARAAGIRIL